MRVNWKSATGAKKHWPGLYSIHLIRAYYRKWIEQGYKDVS